MKKGNKQKKKKNQVNRVRYHPFLVSSQIPKSSGEDEVDRNNPRWRKDTLSALAPQLRRLQKWGAAEVRGAGSHEKEPWRVQGLLSREGESSLLAPSLLLLVLTGRKQMAQSHGFNWE